jgi:hypothetical protein
MAMYPVKSSYCECVRNGVRMSAALVCYRAMLQSTMTILFNITNAALGSSGHGLTEVVLIY